MKHNRVVITGMGVIAPNGNGLDAFATALKAGQSGIRYIELLKNLNFTCQVAGVPQDIENLKQKYFDIESLSRMNSMMVFAGIAAIDCWKDTGFTVPQSDEERIDWNTGAIVGVGIGGVDSLAARVVPFTNQGQVRKMGSTMVQQNMASAPSAYVGGLLALGGPVTTNSCACTTGIEAIANAFFMIKFGRIKRMLAGATEGASEYIWSQFDSMRVLARGYNDTPEQASRPMSASASGFVPGSGAGMLMLESLESAVARGAKIYAEILGADINCGGQRQGGSITAPNPIGAQRCIRQSIEMAGIHPEEIDVINGHLTATKADPVELHNWQQALKCDAKKLPLINSTKSMIGHALGAAGSIESVACILQLHKKFVHGSINCNDLHPEIEPFADSVVHETKNTEINILAKAGFGFGDVNGCLIFKRWNEAS